jgi:hypothetical protein
MIQATETLPYRAYGSGISCRQHQLAIVDDSGNRDVSNVVHTVAEASAFSRIAIVYGLGNRDVAVVVLGCGISCQQHCQSSMVQATETFPL